MNRQPLNNEEKEQRKENLNDGWGGWKGYMEMKRDKLQRQQQTESPLGGEPSKDLAVSATTVRHEPIFKDIAIYVDGFTVPSAGELKQLVLLHGGSYHHYYDPRSTTHIVAACLPNSKLKNLRSQNVVRTDWILESVREGKLLSHHNYRLYDTTQRKLRFKPLIADATPTIVALDKHDAESVDHDEVAAVIPNAEEIKPPSGNSTLLKEFYGRSRLHHISTMGMEFRQYVGGLRVTSNLTFHGMERLKRWMSIHAADSDFQTPVRRSIMHVDMDCFFVSVGLRDRPDLRDKPVAVTHSRSGGLEPREDCADGFGSTSEIACCNYEARTAGVRNGSWMGDARRLCPNLITIPYDFNGYKEVAQKLYSIVASYTLDIEAVSCDEMYVDCTRLLEETGATPQQFASCLRKHVYEETRCTCSVGIAENFLLARMATRKAKPNGQFIVWQHEDLLSTEEVTNLPGVGRALGSRLTSMCVVTCGDLQKISLNRLKTDFGPKMGQTLYNMCRGIDDRIINHNRMRHSVSAEINYGVRLKQFSDLQKLLKEVAEEVETRLRKISTNGKTITLKMKVRKPEAPVKTVKFMGHGICDSLSRAVTLVREVDDAHTIASECEKLFQNINIIVSDIRGVGIQVSQLSTKECHQRRNTLTRFLAGSTSTDSIAGGSGSSRDQQFLLTEVKDCKTSLLLPNEGSNASLSKPKSSKAKRQSPMKLSPTKRQSPRKLSPAKKVPFKYMTMDKHFISDTMKPICATSFQVDPATSNIESNEEGQKRDLCAAMPFEEMASLFREWTDTFDVPVNDDLNIVRECIANAVYNRELEKVVSVLRTLRRLITYKRNSSMAWQCAYNSLVAQTQDVVMQVHGGKLETLHLF